MPAGRFLVRWDCGVGQPLTILPALMQLVQTFMRWLLPLTLALTACRLGFQRRRVVLWAWEMLLPNCGPLPQSSHFCAMWVLRFSSSGDSG